MATKLFPPSIDGKLPAQIGNTLNIPYTHNRAVGDEDFSKLCLKIKTVSTNIDLAILEGDDKKGNFTITGDNKFSPVVGQYYKAQLAYVTEDGTIGYYSTTGVFKYTAEPTIEIRREGFQLIGVYTPPATDAIEKVYEYCFNVYQNDNLIESSGIQLHNSSEDTDNQQKDIYKLNNLITGENIKITYEVKSINGLTTVAEDIASITVGVLSDASIAATPDYETGTITISCSRLENNTQYYLTRSIDSDIDVVIEVLSDSSGKIEFIDRTALQGIEYTYDVYDQNFNKSEQSATVLCDFEDIFLFDGEYQLKIKFNPKVSSFKTTILESKLDTIGGQFPFFFRNGNTYYKEFQISGLISYWMDNEELFMTNEELRFGRSTVRTSTNAADSNDINLRSTQLIGSNVAAERAFKLKVLEWLNNGKPKLFRSPTEGNYIVRLMNVSLSPDDTVGRMLHTFNSTAYEIAEYNYKNLIEYNFLKGA